MHPLATDPTVPEALRAAFAKVTHQIVRTYEDGYEWSYNLNRTQTLCRADILEKERGLIGKRVDPLHGALRAVDIREVK